MYDVIYFNVWSDIICTAAKLLHGTSKTSQMFQCYMHVLRRQVRMTALEQPRFLLQQMSLPDINVEFIRR